MLRRQAGLVIDLESPSRSVISTGPQLRMLAAVNGALEETLPFQDEGDEDCQGCETKRANDPEHSAIRQHPGHAATELE